MPMTRVEFRVEEEIKKEFYELCPEKSASKEFKKFMLDFIEKKKGVPPSLPKKERKPKKPKAEPKKTEIVIEEPKEVIVEELTQINEIDMNSYNYKPFSSWEDILEVIKWKKYPKDYEKWLSDRIKNNIAKGTIKSFSDIPYRQVVIDGYIAWGKTTK